MNLNELTYVAAAVGQALYPDDAPRRAHAALIVREGLRALESGGWTFTAVEPDADPGLGYLKARGAVPAPPGGPPAETLIRHARGDDPEHDAYVDACNERDMLRAQLDAVRDVLRNPDHSDAQACEAALAILESAPQ